MSLEAEIERAAHLRAGLRRFVRQTEEFTSRGGLSTQRYDLLLFVQAAPGRRTTTSELTKVLQLKQPAVTELVKQTARAGLVRRTPDEIDRRRIWIELTPTGRKRLLACLHALGDARDALAATITEGKQLTPPSP